VSIYLNRRFQDFTHYTQLALNSTQDSALKHQVSKLAEEFALYNYQDQLNPEDLKIPEGQDKLRHRILEVNYRLDVDGRKLDAKAELVLLTSKPGSSTGTHGHGQSALNYNRILSGSSVTQNYEKHLVDGQTVVVPEGEPITRNCGESYFFDNIIHNVSVQGDTELRELNWYSIAVWDGCKELQNEAPSQWDESGMRIMPK